MTAKGKVILIDGNSLLYRAFYAMPHFSTMENLPTNAVYGFALMLFRLIEEEKPDTIIVAFDAPAKTFRHDEYDKYKAHRKPAPDELYMQSPLARELVDAFNIPILEIEGFEADDVVGTAARLAEEENYDVLIVTGDLDALQLVDEKVKVMITVKGVSETIIYDESAVEERYGLKPHQLPDYKALKGDPSDNIPGVPGVGDKTARKLMSDFNNLENLIKNLDTVENIKLQGILQSSLEQAKLSKRLATIVTDVHIDVDFAKSRFKGPNTSHLRDLFKKLEFRTLLRKLPEETGQGDLFTEPEKVRAAIHYEVVEKKSALGALVSDVIKAEGAVLRINGDSSKGIEAEAFGMAISSMTGKTWYVSFGDGSEVSIIDMKQIMELDTVTKYGHNLKYEIQIARRNGIEFKGRALDVMLAAYLLNPSRSSYDISVLALEYLGEELPIREGKYKAEVSSESVIVTEADVLRRLAPILEKKLTDDALDHLMAEVEMPLMPILADMEQTGVAVDTDWLNKLSGRLWDRICALENEIYTLAGTEFNIGSPKQLQQILFEKLGLPAGRKTKTGYSTDAETLAMLAPAHEIVEKILEYRELTKLKSTYADSLPKLINPRTGRIHTSLNQAVTSTGRLSSSEPNLQNIPIKTDIGREIRRAFTASPGNLLVSADYSQIELRILAHISRDSELIRAFQDGKDIHTKTAVKLFDVSSEDVTPEMRRQAKTVNFAVIYGMSDYGLSRELGIPGGVAKQYIDEYFSEYPGVKRYTRETLTKARLDGYVQSLMGRRRYFPELNSPNRSIREFAERAAVNMPIQGTAADIVKLSMISVYRRLNELNLRAKLILQVHDELVLDVPENEIEQVVSLVKDAMGKAYTLDVPLEVEVKVGKDWRSAQAITNNIS